MNKYSSRHSNLNFAHHFVINGLLQNGAYKNQHQELRQRETIHDKFVIFAKLVRQKISIKLQNMCIFSEMCAEGIFVYFIW